MVGKIVRFISRPQNKHRENALNVFKVIESAFDAYGYICHCEYAEILLILKDDQMKAINNFLNKVTTHNRRLLGYTPGVFADIIKFLSRNYTCGCPITITEADRTRLRQIFQE